MLIVRGRERSKGPSAVLPYDIESESYSVNVCQDGIFWMTKDEFFEHFQNIYLCAHDMSKFQLLESGCPTPKKPSSDSKPTSAASSLNAPAQFDAAPAEAPVKAKRCRECMRQKCTCPKVEPKDRQRGWVRSGEHSVR